MDAAAAAPDSASSIRPPTCSTARASTPPVSSDSPAKRRCPNGRSINIFRARAAVVEEYLRCIQQVVGDPIRPGPDAANRTPRERILALFETPSPDGQMRGCPFHNAAVEASEVMPEIQDIVHEHKRAYIKGLIKLARQAGAANPTLLGNQLGLLYEGAAALSTSLDDPAPWTHARKAATTLIDQAVG